MCVHLPAHSVALPTIAQEEKAKTKASPMLTPGNATLRLMRPRFYCKARGVMLNNLTTKSTCESLLSTHIVYKRRALHPHRGRA